ncbi:hydroxypyruvate isomerase family protein [Stackebrandtia nassauensis]|uniref:Hydroxypyruvate isomerase n=1 Tax=Stackebrandtia nassauensis (strain DSM 44728 / CIP 108903 / NRRL B-16338 / NBRC 102104 / LLR-40K-21) TaxID=446470 RepID=D3Q652_STANL|nr:TIM barrel protein [Stackebrandtia nassauensis]ADD42227.1 Hydroxypyruvate isomerase [Stackebrandtia nassauensis DSM 44728]
MTRFTANLSILFTELPLLQRPAAARAAGLEACEFWWPFPTPTPSDSEVDAFASAVTDAGLQLTGLNFAAGDMPGGDRGLLSSPSESAAFRDNIDIALGIADRLGCKALNALYGNRVDGVDPNAQDALGAENLALAAAAAAKQDAVVLVEAVNSIENPRYPLTSSTDVIAVLDRVGSANLKFLADFYHLARMGENFDEVLSVHFDRIGHVQIADVPGRGEPGSGTFDFAALFDDLDVRGYSGLVGLEYKPTVASADSLGWMEKHRQ